MSLITWTAALPILAQPNAKQVRPVSRTVQASNRAAKAKPIERRARKVTLAHGKHPAGAQSPAAQKTSARPTLLLGEGMPLFQGVDTNHDGITSPEERAAALQYFQAWKQKQCEYLRSLPRVAPGAPMPDDPESAKQLEELLSGKKIQAPAKAPI
jgi:hypothetical protein